VARDVAPHRRFLKKIGYDSIMTRVVLAVAALIAAQSLAAALEPREVILIVNRNMPESADVADHYRQKRQIPRENVIPLDLPTGEDMSRRDYDTKLVAPLRAALKGRKEKIKCLLCIYGVSLRVGPAELSAKDKAELAKVDEELKEAKQKAIALARGLKDLNELGAKGAAETRKAMDQAEAKAKDLERKRGRIADNQSGAAVDNELMLLWWDDYDLRRFLINPLHWQSPEKAGKGKPQVLMTARLDGPTPAIAKRLVDDAVEVEKTGLKGKVYVDARGIGYDPKKDPGYGYGGYDESMREMAALLKDKAKMDVVLDNKPEVFAAGACPDCALYCGWYSLAKFVDSCGFNKGAVAWHLASSEAVTLRGKNSTVWCPNILLKGACATLGPVGEPYTIGFPKPAEFFGFLVTGEYTLVECYARTAHLTSWMTTLIGDPLYNPYKASPRLKVSDLSPSPKGGKFLLSVKDDDD
jgi:uncharacterized protein (TIGR03790 family)